MCTLCITWSYAESIHFVKNIDFHFSKITNITAVGRLICFCKDLVLLRLSALLPPCPQEKHPSLNRFINFIVSFYSLCASVLTALKAKVDVKKSKRTRYDCALGRSRSNPRFLYGSQPIQVDYLINPDELKSACIRRDLSATNRRIQGSAAPPEVSQWRIQRSRKKTGDRLVNFEKFRA